MVDRITTAQFRSLVNPRKVSKKNMARIKKGKDVIKSEDEICIEFVNWLEGHPSILFFSHIRSESKTSNPALLKHFSRMGVRSGLPDYFIFAVNDAGHVIEILIEMKTEDGKASPEQKRFIELSNEVSDRVSGHICFSFAEARDAVGVELCKKA